MTVTEKVAYLKGLTEGLGLDAEKSETKVIKAMMDVLEDLALTVTDLEEDVDIMAEQLDAVDEDLGDLEEFIYDEEDCDCDCGCDCDDCDDDLYEVECPACHESVYVDESILEDGSIECPNCGENLEFEIEFDDEEGEDEE